MGRRWFALFAFVLACSALLHRGVNADDDEKPPQCYTSNRGYQCMLEVCNNFKFHWSIGGQPADPTTCQYAQPSTTNGTTSAVAALNGNVRSTMLHVALEAPVDGYVAMSWPNEGGEMVPADAVAGFIGTGNQMTVQAYFLKGFAEVENQPDPNVQVTNAGVIQGSNNLTACFSRQISTVGQAGVQLALNGQPLNFAGGPEHRLSDHSMHCAVMVSLSAVLNPSEFVIVGSNIEPKFHHDHKEEMAKKAAHGWLMMLAWALIIPIGMLMPRYRSVLSSAPFFGFIKTDPDKRWWILHQVFQWTGVIFFMIAMYLIVSIEGLDPETWRGANNAHGSIGISILSLLCLHLVIAIFRPKPGAPKRHIWELAHHWGARLIILLALINLLIGPKVYAQSGGSWGGLYAAYFIFLAFVGGVAFVLWRSNKQSAEKLVWTPHSAPVSHIALSDI